MKVERLMSILFVGVAYCLIGHSLAAPNTQCHSLDCYPRQSLVDSSKRNADGYGPLGNLSPDGGNSQVDGVMFQLRFSAAFPYKQSSGATKTVQTEPSLIPSRVQLAVFAPVVSMTLPALVFDVLAHSDGYVSSRIFANLNGTKGLLAQGATFFNGSSGEVVPMFCSWKRNRAAEIHCGITNRAMITETAIRDSRFEAAMVNVSNFRVGVEARLDSLAPLLVSTFPKGFAPFVNADPEWALNWTSSSSLHARILVANVNAPSLCEATDPFQNNTEATCVFGPDGDWNYDSPKTHFSGCASVDEAPPARSASFKGKSLLWCPTKLSANSTYSKTLPSGKPNLNWALCSCKDATVEPTLSAVSSSTPSQSPSTAEPTIPTGSTVDRSVFEYCAGAFTSFAPYQCNPFNCTQGSVRCVDDPFPGSTCGAPFSIDRCDKLGVAIEACPLDEYYTCGNGECIHAGIGAAGCDDKQGVRFSPVSCTFDVSTMPPHTLPPGGLPNSSDSNLIAASAVVPLAATLAIVVALATLAVCFIQWRKSPNRHPVLRPRRSFAFKSAFSSKDNSPTSLAPEEPSPGSVIETDANSVSTAVVAHVVPANVVSPEVESLTAPPTAEVTPQVLKHYGSSARHSQLVSPTPTVWSQGSQLSTPRFEPLPTSVLLSTMHSSKSLRKSQDSSSVFSPASAQLVRSISFRSSATGRERDDDDSESRSSATSSHVNNLFINFEEIELGELLGSGGNGRIFRASYNGTPVAVKELYSVMRGRSSEFFREFEALRLLRHPHIIQLFGTCVAPSMDAQGLSRHFIVTELAHESLADRLARVDDPIDTATAERYAAEIASAGAFIHSQQMIHFDFKPQNVLLDMSGTVKVADLGIAKFVQHRGPDQDVAGGGGRGAGNIMTTISSGQGTPAYMSPELLSGDDPSRITYKVDVYAFGVMCWEIVHRCPPYPPSWSLLTLFRNVDAGYRPPIDDSKLPSSPLRQIVETCWDADPAKRPNFKDVIALLRQHRKRSRGSSEFTGAAQQVAFATPPLMPKPFLCGNPSLPSASPLPATPDAPGALKDSLQEPPLNSPSIAFTTHATVVGLHPGARIKVRRTAVLHEEREEQFQTGDDPLEGEVLSIAQDGYVSVQMLTSGTSTNEPVAIKPEDIVRVVQKDEEDEDVFFFPADRTIRGLALAHARRKVQEFKRAMEREQQTAAVQPPSTPLALPAEVKSEDLKLVVVRNAAVPENDAIHDEEEKKPEADVPSMPLPLPLKLDLTEAPVVKDGNAEVAGAEGETNELDEMSRDLFITDGVALDAEGGLWKRAKNRKIFKAPEPASGSAESVTAAIPMQAVAFREREEDPLMRFPSISEQSLVILSELGTGACGMVYKGIHITTLQLVAVKRVNVSDRLKRHQVVRETRIMLANNIQLQTPRPPDSITDVGGRETNGVVQSFRIEPTRISGPSQPKPLEKMTSFSQKLISSAKKMMLTHDSSSSALMGAKQSRRPRHGSVSGTSHRSSHPRKFFGKRFSSSDSPAHVLQPARSEGTLESSESSFSTKAVAREITQVKASSFACDKIVKLYDAALFSREAFSGTSTGMLLQRKPASLSGETDLALVMEFLDGGSLEDHMKHSGPCEDETTLSQVALDCLEALYFLETNRIIHRDIKPANVMLSRRGTAKLTDFGVVKEVDEDTSAMVKTFVGTISYMSPERLRGHAYSFVSDIWSFGMTLLAFALGRYPVPKEHSKNIFALLEFFEKHDVLGGMESRFSSELLLFFRACLQPDPILRPSAVDLINHPFIVSHAQARATQRGHDESDHLPALSREERLLDLEYITRKVVDKMFTDWIRQQHDHEQIAAALGLKTPRSVEFSFPEESFVRLSRQLGVSAEEVRKAFENQIAELRTVLKL